MLTSRVIRFYNQVVRDRQEADVFHSFAVCGDEVICAIRRHGIRDVYNVAKTLPAYDSRILFQKFDVAGGNLIDEPVEIMPVGEDPRCIVVRDRPFVLTPASPGQALNYVLFDVNARNTINLEFRPSGGLRYGKNWQPFVLRMSCTPSMHFLLSAL